MFHFSGSKMILVFLVLLLSGVLAAQNGQPQSNNSNAAEATTAIMQQQIDFQSFEIEQLKRDLLQEHEVVELLIRQLKSAQPDNDSESTEQGEQDPPCAVGEPTVMLAHRQRRASRASHTIFVQPELRNLQLVDVPH